MKSKNIQQINIKNKRATFDYFVIKRFVAGIVLTGTEIKSIRQGKAGLVDTFCYISNGEVWAKNIYIAPYDQASFGQHNVRRDRKLLLNKKEIHTLLNETKNPGNTIVPLSLFINEKGLAKLEVGLVKGKREYDKRNTLKANEGRREIERVTKNYRYGK